MVYKNSKRSPTPIASDLHLQQVLKDPEFLGIAAKIVSDTDREQIESLAQEFMINPSWIINIIRFGHAIMPGQKAQHSRAQIEFDDKGVLVRIAPNTALDDITSEWPNIEYAKWKKYTKLNAKTGYYELHKTTKNKPPKYPELIYAVFRGRQKGLTFPQIFKKYEAQDLPPYIKTTDEFLVSKDLETYYRQHKPTL